MFFDSSKYSTESVGKKKRKWDNTRYSHRRYAYYRRYDWDEPDYPQIDEDEIDIYEDSLLRSMFDKWY